MRLVTCVYCHRVFADPDAMHSATCCNECFARHERLAQEARLQRIAARA